MRAMDGGVAKPSIAPAHPGSRSVVVNCRPILKFPPFHGGNTSSNLVRDANNINILSGLNPSGPRSIRQIYGIYGLGRCRVLPDADARKLRDEVLLDRLDDRPLRYAAHPHSSEWQADSGTSPWPARIGTPAGRVAPKSLSPVVRSPWHRRWTPTKPRPCQGWGRGFESLRPLQ
jgi:hypothetical protein